MQESSELEAEEHVVEYVPSDRFVFHTCPLCESLARFPEKPKTPLYFDKIKDYLASLEKESVMEQQE